MLCKLKNWLLPFILTLSICAPILADETQKPTDLFNSNNKAVFTGTVKGRPVFCVGNKDLLRIQDISKDEFAIEMSATVPELSLKVVCYQCCVGEEESADEKQCQNLGFKNWKHRKNCGC